MKEDEKEKRKNRLSLLVGEDSGQGVETTTKLAVGGVGEAESGERK